MMAIHMYILMLGSESVTWEGCSVVPCTVLVTSTHHCAIVTCYWEDQLNMSASPLWVDVHITKLPYGNYSSCANV